MSGARGEDFSAFLSTPSARRATQGRNRCRAAAAISIHALREEGDVASTIVLIVTASFLSTPSARRATSSCLYRPP